MHDDKERPVWSPLTAAGVLSGSGGHIGNWYLGFDGGGEGKRVGLGGDRVVDYSYTSGMAIAILSRPAS